MAGEQAVHDLVTPGMFEYGVVGPDGEFIPYDAVSRKLLLKKFLGLMTNKCNWV